MVYVTTTKIKQGIYSVNAPIQDGEQGGPEGFTIEKTKNDWMLLDGNGNEVGLFKTKKKALIDYQMQYCC